MWKELLRSLEYDTELLFSEPCNPKELLEIEDVLGIRLPEDLKSLLLETNGINDIFGLHIIWSKERIKTNNLRFRSRAIALNSAQTGANLLFFADAGNGDQYAFNVQDAKVEPSKILIWRHEDDRIEIAANSLAQYLKLLFGHKDDLDPQSSTAGKGA